ncbi:MAG: SH3 domain-containing protein, partial [Niameybacter sp.]
MQLKKSLLSLCVVASAMLMPTLVYGQAYGKVNVATLNMRQEPKTTATNMGQLNQQDEVDIIGRANNEWLEIQTSNGGKAYVFADYVSIEETEGEIIGQGVRL